MIPGWQHCRLVNNVKGFFMFLIMITYWCLVRDIANGMSGFQIIRGGGIFLLWSWTLFPT